MDEGLIERNNRAENREWHKVVDGAFVLAAHCHKKNNDLRIHENTLIPAEIARWKADDLRVDERADNSREHRPEKQFQNIFMDESRQSRARSGVNEHGGQDTDKNNVGEQSQKGDDWRGVCLNEINH